MGLDNSLYFIHGEKMDIGNTNFMRKKMGTEKEIQPQFNSIQPEQSHIKSDNGEVLIVETMTRTITKIYPNGDQYTTFTSWDPNNKQRKVWKKKGPGKSSGSNKKTNSKDNSLLVEGQEVL